MQHSLGPHTLQCKIRGFSSRCSRNLRKLQKFTCSTACTPALAACGGLAAGSGLTVLACSAHTQPQDGGSSIGSSSSGNSNGNGIGNNKRSSQSSRGGRSNGALDFGSPLRRCTDALLVLNGLLFVLQWASRDVLMLWGAKINPLITAGQWWRLITCSFLHTSLLHLAINSYTLNSLGPHVELLAGRARFAAVYLGSTLLGSTASYLMTPAPSVGASAGLFGLGAALAVCYARNRDALGRRRSEAVLQQLGVTLLLNLAYSMMSKRIDNWGHLGGLVGGAAVTWLLGPAFVMTNDGRLIDQPPLRQLAFQPDSKKGGDASSSSSSSGLRNAIK